MQQNQFTAKFRAALAISRMDKKHRETDKLIPGTGKQDMVQIPVEYNGRTMNAYAKQVPIEADDTDSQGEVEDLSFGIVKPFKQSEFPTKKGMMFKKSPHFLQGWQQRMVIVEDQKLKYFIPDQLQAPFGILDFNIMSYDLQEIRSGQILTEFILKPHGSQKLFQFKGMNPEDTKAWLEVIHLNRKNSKGVLQVLSSLSLYTRFWRTDRLSAESFASTAETGDILLFRGTGTNCAVQRTFTGSEYDHAALVLRFASGNLYIFEATGYYGVGLCGWDSMIKNKWYELYDKIVVRKLELPRDNEFLQTIQKFVNDNLGKKYSCSPQKLLKLKSTIQDVKKQDVKAERTFFCSELVAAAYKELGLLPKEKSAAQYWPGSLSSENKQFKILKGELKPEQLIDFTGLK